MSTRDSDVAPKNDPHLEAAGRELVHDVATPLATLQLNLQVLSTYLPALMEHCRSAGLPPQLTPERLDSLASLPEALEADIRKIRQAVRSFSSILVPGNVSALSFKTSSNSALSPSRVLLVEDELVHQEIALKQFGDRYQVDVVNNARDALIRVVEKVYGLVLLDLMLSGRDARDLIGELRAAGTADMRIILVSNMPLSASDAAELKVDGVLEKPFRLEALEALLQNRPAS
jgi:Response regulators consisting of a CheY-like receiver domain and a winged-helix DNA-binding domain